MADLREENLILHKVVHEAAQNQITLQTQVTDLQNSLRGQGPIKAQSEAMLSPPQLN